MDYLDSEYYLNRELSWLAFNERVLAESFEESVPLLERLRFLSITASNLDEFFMIRVASIRHLLEKGVNRPDIAGLTPKEQMREISLRVHALMARMDDALTAILTALEREGISFCQPETLDTLGLRYLGDLFEREIYPVVTPMGIDPSHPFPFLASRSLNLAIALKRPEENEARLAILTVPPSLSRIVKLPGKQSYLLLEDILAYYAERFFSGFEILSATTFRITRDADLDIREDSDDLLAAVERSLEKRRKGAALRLEIKEGCSSAISDILRSELELAADEIYPIRTVLGAACFSSFANLEGYDHLRFPAYHPRPSADRMEKPDCTLYEAIENGGILLHHPFESFSLVEDFIAEAAADPCVLAIKQTLYRVSSKSPIIASLERAARAGKEVTVLMEVKARFDEENNILMAKRLEEAGCHVIYGILGLKTHSKITMVIRREEAGIRRYVHLATGNYNGSTAKVYTDVGVFTADAEIATDASAFFNYLSGFADPPVWNQLIVAPLNLRERIVQEIEQEIAHAKAGEKAYIVAKMNSLLDRYIIAKLYEASNAGVKIDLIVRGICVLRPGVKGLSENIDVRSIIGRYLEHSRIFHFRNGGRHDIFISSADWMPRNLNNRVELMTPILEPAHKKRLRAILKVYRRDNMRAWIMQADGSYVRVTNDGREKPLAAQNYLSTDMREEGI